jgi:hypothetical protein
MSLIMSRKSKEEVLAVMRLRYAGRGRMGRSRLLDEFCELCRYERKYAIKLLRGQRRKEGKRSVCNRRWQSGCRIMNGSIDELRRQYGRDFCR